MNHHKILLAIALISLIALTGCMKNNATRQITKEEATLTIRGTAPLTGPYAYYGTEVQKGLAIAFEEQEEKLKEQGITLDIEFQDNMGDAKTSITNYQQFKRDNPSIVISTNTPLSAPLKPLAEKDEIVLLALITGAKDFAKDQEYTFRDAVQSYEQGQTMAQHIAKEGKKSIATLVVNDDYGLSGAKGIEDGAETLGLEIVAQETFANSDTDMKAQITSIKAKEPEAIFLVGRLKGNVQAIKQMEELGIGQESIYTINAFDSAEVIEALGKLAENVTFSSSRLDKKDEKAAAFIEAFEQRYGEEPSIWAIDAYAVGQYLTSSAITCGTKAQEIKRCLEEKEFETIKGTFAFDEQHDALSPLGIYKWQDNEKVLLS